MALVMRSAALCCTLMLAACATTEPAIQTREVPVTIIRVEKCVAEEDIPKRPAPLPKPRPKSISQALDIAVVRVLAWQTYGEKADAVLQGCAG